MARRPRADDGLTRRALLARGATAGAAAMIAAGGVEVPAAAADSRGERLLSLLDAALQLELDGVRAYAVIPETGTLPLAAAPVFNKLRIADHRHAHKLKTELIRLGQQQIPPTPLPAQVPGLQAANTDAAVYAFAITLEQNTIGAYAATIRLIGQASILPTIASIMAEHGQQLVLLRQLAGQPPVPSAFEPGNPPPA